MVSSPESWGLCATCGEIVRLGPDPSVGQNYHADTCPEGLAVPRSLPEGQAGGDTQPAPDENDAAFPSRARHVGLDAGARVMNSAFARLPRGRARIPMLALIMVAVAGIAVTATVVATGGTTNPTRSSAADVRDTVPEAHASGRATASPAPAQSPSAAPSPTAVQSPEPTVRPSAAPSVPTVLVTFQDGLDGWMQEWGNVDLTTTTNPAFDGASLLITTASSSSGIGTGSDDVTSLIAGDTVTYHVWSSGGQGSVQPLVAADNNAVTYAGSAILPSTPGWFTLTWTVPATPSIEGIGLQITNTSNGSITLAIGGLSWPQN